MLPVRRFAFHTLEANANTLIFKEALVNSEPVKD
jgi:hypothetical protein